MSYSTGNVKIIGIGLTGIFMLALMIRISYVIISPQELVFDEPYYDHIASQIASGQGFTFAFSAWFTSIPNQPTSVQEPIYPLFLAFLKILLGPENYFGARIIQAFVGASIPIVVAILGSRVFGWGVGILAAIILALYPPLIYFGRFLMTETLYVFFLVTMVCVVAFQIQASKTTNILRGFTFGLTYLTRSILLVFTPIFLLWVFITNAQFRKRLVAVGFVTLGVLLITGPWVWRNYLVHNAFVPTATKGGWNLYFYNYPEPNYDFNHRWSEIPVPNVDGLTEIERNREYQRQAIGFIKEDPRLIASFAAIKLIDFWNPFLRNERAAFSFLNLLSYGILTLLAFVGLFRHLKQRSFHPVMVFMWLLIGFYATQAMIFTGGGKARLPIEPFLVLLGSETIWISVKWIRERLLY